MAAGLSLESATGIRRESLSSALSFTSFLLAGAWRRLRTIMPLAIITLHLVLVCAAISLLTLICSTGQFWNLPGAGVWICVDLMVSICGIAYSLHPEYAQLVPRLVEFHFTAMAVCLAWMAADNLRNAHPLSGVFFWGFFAFAMLRLGEWIAYRWRLAPTAALEIANAIGYLAIVALLISALLLRVPPTAAPASYTAPLGDPAPALPLAAARARE